MAAVEVRLGDGRLHVVGGHDDLDVERLARLTQAELHEDRAGLDPLDRAAGRRSPPYRARHGRRVRECES